MAYGELRYSVNPAAAERMATKYHSAWSRSIGLPINGTKKETAIREVLTWIVPKDVEECAELARNTLGIGGLLKWREIYLEYSNDKDQWNCRVLWSCTEGQEETFAWQELAQRLIERKGHGW
jgi:hypothetical protein